MSKTGFLFLGALLSVSSFLAAGTGCGGNSASGGSGGTGGDTTASHGSTSTSTSATTGTGGMAPTLDCDSYCTAIMANCTTTNAQFTDMATCKGFCSHYPVGMISDMAGDTLGCRLYHAGAAKTAPDVHCVHAGPTGGDKDPMGTAGTCGEPCTAFCEAATAICPTEAPDMTTCTTMCKGYAADTASYSTADTTTNDMGCRFYHLSAAVSAPTTHCPHILAVSTACTM